MYASMDILTADISPFTTQQPLLLDCDIDLVSEALTLILNPYSENSASPECIQLTHALNNYIKECNNAFLASERIRLFLLLTLFANFIIILIALISIPVSLVSMTLIGITGFIFFSINLFTLCQQMSTYQQQINWDMLKKHCSEYTKKLILRESTTEAHPKPLGHIPSPTSHSCLFTPKKSLVDKLRTDTEEENLNHFQNRLSTIDEDSIDSNSTLSVSNSK